LRTTGVVEPSSSSSTTAAARGERVAQGASVDREGQRLVAAAVEHAGDLTGAAQAPRGARGSGVAGQDAELRGLACHGGDRW
jgi:hypothetical protein